MNVGFRVPPRPAGPPAIRRAGCPSRCRAWPPPTSRRNCGRTAGRPEGRDRPGRAPVSWRVGARLAGRSPPPARCSRRRARAAIAPPEQPAEPAMQHPTAHQALPLIPHATQRTALISDSPPSLPPRERGGSMRCTAELVNERASIEGRGCHPFRRHRCRLDRGCGLGRWLSCRCRRERRRLHSTKQVNVSTLRPPPAPPAKISNPKKTSVR